MHNRFSLAMLLASAVMLCSVDTPARSSDGGQVETRAVRGGRSSDRSSTVKHPGAAPKNSVRVSAASGSVAGTPVNDNCANAILILDGVTAFNTLAATTDGPDEPLVCGLDFGSTQIQKDIWYEYDATCTGDLTVSLCSGDYDSKVAIYDVCGRCPPGQPAKSCNDDFCSVQSQFTTPVVAGGCYTIRVGGGVGTQLFPASGTGDVFISCDNPPGPIGACCAAGACLGNREQAQCSDLGQLWFEDEDCVDFICPFDPPPGDACVDAVEVFTNQPLTATSVGAVGTDVTTCGTNDFRDIWHIWTADCTGIAAFEQCQPDFDSTMAIFDSCGGTQLACSDDGFCRPGETILLDVIQGETYFIRIAGHQGATGTYTLNVDACDSERACCGGGPPPICITRTARQCLLQGGAPQAVGSMCGTDADANGVDDACEPPMDTWIWQDFNGGAPDGYLPDMDQNLDYDNADSDGDATTGVDDLYDAAAAVADGLVWLGRRFPFAGLPTSGTDHAPLIQNLAERMATNAQSASPNGHGGSYLGSFADDVAAGVRAILNSNANGLMQVAVTSEPTFASVVDWVATGDQGVTLLVGFYHVEGVNVVPGSGFVVDWRRTGGHYVTVAGVDSVNNKIALSDPDADRAEVGAPGFVRGPDHNHDGDADPATTPNFGDVNYAHIRHAVETNASADVYDVTPAIGPGGTWVLSAQGDPLSYGALLAPIYAAASGGSMVAGVEFVSDADLLTNGYPDPVVCQTYAVIEAAIVVAPVSAQACCATDTSCVDASPLACLETANTPAGAGSVCLGNGVGADDVCVGCPTATIDIGLSLPPNGTVDARQPHALASPLPRFGIGSPSEPIIIKLNPALPGAEACFDLCETDVDAILGANSIVNVTHLGGGTYVIALEHAIAPAAVTTISYSGDGSFLTLTAHPADVNADGVATELDAVRLITCCIEGSCNPLPGLYNCDVDRSGLTAPVDLLRLIDTLNGADTFAPWLDTQTVTNAGQCP